MSNSTLVTAQDLIIKFNNNVVLNKVNFTLHENEIITIIGPNGAGKSSLIKALLGLLPIVNGVITWHQQIDIGYMPQKINLSPLMPITVLRFLEIKGKQYIEQIDPVLQQLGIERIKYHPLQNISGGELQRVLLARALLSKPKLLVLDEPTQGIDLIGQAKLYQLLREIVALQQCSIIMVSHDLHFVMQGTDQVMCINGHVCCQGRPEEICQDPKFIELFGEHDINNLAIYSHNHNHNHTHLGEET